MSQMSQRKTRNLDVLVWDAQTLTWLLQVECISFFLFSVCNGGLHSSPSSQCRHAWRPQKAQPQVWHLTVILKSIIGLGIKYMGISVWCFILCSIVFCRGGMFCKIWEAIQHHRNQQPHLNNCLPWSRSHLVLISGLVRPKNCPWSHYATVEITWLNTVTLCMSPALKRLHGIRCRVSPRCRELLAVFSTNDNLLLGAVLHKVISAPTRLIDILYIKPGQHFTLLTSVRKICFSLADTCWQNAKIWLCRGVRDGPAFWALFFPA